jgi:hypothetical protein
MVRVGTRPEFGLDERPNRSTPIDGVAEPVENSDGAVNYRRAWVLPACGRLAVLSALATGA